MASSYKYLSQNDRVVSTTDLTELQTITSASWTVNSFDYYSNIESGSTSLFDVTIGRSSETSYYTAASASTWTKEKTIYNQFAKVLIGHDTDNSILKFSLDADSNTSNNILHNAIFVTFNRSLIKDKIKRGTFQLKFNVTGTTDYTLTDVSGALGPTYRACPIGEFGLLYVSGASGHATTPNNTNLTGGLIFYEAGVAVVSPYIFARSGSNPNPSSSVDSGSIGVNQLGLLASTPEALSGTFNIANLFFSGTQAQAGFGIASNLLTASFQSVTELNSTIYFCRAFNNEFNYSSNPTYLSSSQIYVKNGDPTVPPSSYITAVGLYSDDNQLLAVAKLSEPIKKTPETELIARVRLDF